MNPPSSDNPSSPSSDVSSPRPRYIFETPAGKPTEIAGFSHDSHNWVVDADLLVPVHPPDLCDICRIWAEHAHHCAQHCWEVYERSRDEATGVQECVARGKIATEIRLDESRRHNGELLEWLGDRAMDVRRVELENAGLAQELKTARAEVEKLRNELREAWSLAASGSSAAPSKGRKAKGRGIEKRERRVGDASARGALTLRDEDATIDAPVVARSSLQRSLRRQTPLASSKKL